MFKPSRRKAFLSIVLMAFLISMCRFYDEKLGYVTYQNGWSCQTYTDYFGSGLNVESGHECKVVCANGTTSPAQSVQNPLELEKVDLGAFCTGVQSTSTREEPTEPPATPTATPISGVTESASTLPPPATATVTATPSPIVPLLTNEMTSCGKNNQLGWWVNFRLAGPRLNLSGKDLEVTIGGALSPCGINQENTSLLTCFPPPSVTYPAPVVVKVDGVEVNNFDVNLSETICAGPTPTSSGANPVNTDSASTSAPEAPPTEPPSTPSG